MINLALIDKAHFDDVPDVFFDTKAASGLPAALAALGDTVLSNAGLDLAREEFTFSELISNVRRLAGEELKIMKMRIALRQESGAEYLAQDCAQFVRNLSTIEQRAGGAGLMLLAAEADSPELNRILLQTESFRELMEVVD